MKKQVLLLLFLCVFVWVKNACALDILVIDEEGNGEITTLPVVLSAGTASDLKTWRSVGSYSSEVDVTSISRRGQTAFSWGSGMFDSGIYTKIRESIAPFSTLRVYMRAEKGLATKAYITLHIEDEAWVSKEKLKVSVGYDSLDFNLDKAQFNTEKKEIDIDKVDGISIWIEGSEMNEAIYVDTVALLGKRNETTVLSEGTSQIQSGGTAPIVGTVLLDGQSVTTGDYVESTFKITATVSDPEEGVATYSIQLLSDTNSVLSTVTSNGSLSTSSFTASRNMTDIAEGSYRVKIIALNGEGVQTIKETSLFNISNRFNLSQFKNAPNPFNPNQEKTQIDYQLSVDADIEIYVYAISGEKLWAQKYRAGEVGKATAGFNSVEWDGKNRFGEIVANGAYVAYIKAKAKGKTTIKSRKLMVLK